MYTNVWHTRLYLALVKSKIIIASTIGGQNVQNRRSTLRISVFFVTRRISLSWKM